MEFAVEYIADFNLIDAAFTGAYSEIRLGGGQNSDIGGGGDLEECSYQNGIKHGRATYTWKAGHK